MTKPRAPHRYRKFKKDTCEKCGFAGQACQLDVHHLDRDRSNNDPDNLQTLCANCHRAEVHREGPARTEVFQIRLSPAEKLELNERAKLQGIAVATLIRERLNLDTSSREAVIKAPTVEPLVPIDAEPGLQWHDQEFKRLFAQHKLRYSTATAERMARKELDAP